MGFSHFLIIAAAATSVLGYPRPSPDHSLPMTLTGGNVVRRDDLDLGPCEVVDNPKSYGLGDNIEQDLEVNCYHYPLSGRKGHETGYRVCYIQDEPCNIRWREDVLEYREVCETEQKDLNPDLCTQLWEPDVESPTYCAGKEVKEDGKGNRVMPCGPPTGIGQDANCPPAKLGPPCPDKQKCDRRLQPNVTCGQPCRDVWSECDLNFRTVCITDTQLPCQSNCGDSKTCIRGLAKNLPPGLTWAWVNSGTLESGQLDAIIGNATLAQTTPEVESSEENMPVEVAEAEKPTADELEMEQNALQEMGEDTDEGPEE